MPRRRNRPLFESLEDRTLMAVFTVTTTADSGTGSLRWAIDQSNNTPGVDTIAFNLPTRSGPIRPTSALPLVYDAAIIDGTTQPGYSGTPVVQIDGSLAGAGIDGLKLFGGCTVKGLSVTGFTGQGITTIPRTDVNFGGNTIQQNWVGITPSGTPDGNGLHGVGLYSSNNLVGGATANLGNVIANNAGGDGVFSLGSLFGGGHGFNTIEYNTIGLNPAGNAAMANLDGIAIQDSPSNIVTHNILSGNKEDGLLVMNPASTGNTITANIIGLDGSGTKAIGNGLYGIEMQSSDNVIGGTTTAARNIISANGNAGIVFWKSGASSNTVQGNYIGTDISGTKALGNTDQGIAFSDAGANQVGGTTPGAGNIISGNGQEGVGIFTSTGEVIQGNTIGADINGNPMGNATWGITAILDSSGIVIGGSQSGAGNVIVDNGKTAVEVSNDTTATVTGNSYSVTPTVPKVATMINFAAAAVSTVFTSGSVQITVLRSGDTSGPASVSYSTVDGSGTAGVAYTAAHGTLNFAPGQVAAKLTIKLLHGSGAAKYASFSMQLSNPLYATLGTTNSVAITVQEQVRSAKQIALAASAARSPAK